MLAVVPAVDGSPEAVLGHLSGKYEKKIQDESLKLIYVLQVHVKRPKDSNYVLKYGA